MVDLAGCAILTADEMRAAEEAAMRGGVASIDLMERAGSGVARTILARVDTITSAPSALVICGPGNNGGDGYVVARHLAGAGWRVGVARFGTLDGISAEARANYERCIALGLESVETLPRGRDWDVVVDAGFGIGVRQPFKAPDLLREGLARGAYRVAVDLPSGLDADTGRASDDVVPVDLTVTFHAPKAGHLLADGPARCGTLEIVDIGLGAAPEAPRMIAPPKGLDKRGVGHKFDHGAALVLSGGAGRTGAARLAARAALRVGAGLVTLAVPPAAQFEVAAQVTAIMLARLESASEFGGLIEDRKAKALCLGPGLGLGAREGDLVAAALESGLPCVIDADALTLISRDAALAGRLHEGCVLTPHGGEFARLWPDLSEDWRGGVSKITVTREAARRSGAMVLLKGADTVIAGPDGEVVVQVSGYGRDAPWLATAGAGDVLAGLITGLLARGKCAFKAAEAGAWLHLEAARAFGPGLIAEDLPEMLPEVMRDLVASAP